MFKLNFLAKFNTSDKTQWAPLFNSKTWICLAIIIVLAFFTYFFRYAETSSGFWDEGYHIASAQKYLNGVYFMEQHPPLGKLLIALGEKIFYPNGQYGKKGSYDNKFINTDQASNYPDDFSFKGYRFFSALLGWLTAPLLFLIFLYITRNSLYSALLSCLYIFDNALIVHLRGAMLEGPLIFFSVLMILIYFLILEYGEKISMFIVLNLFFGITFGLVASTKLWGLAMILLLPAYFYKLLPNWKKIIKALGLFTLGFLIIYISVWQIHFSLGKKIVPALSDNGYYRASPEYKKILAEGTSGNFSNFPIMFLDSVDYVFSYNEGVPKLKLSDPKENGSPFFVWPLGARAINYLWNEVSKNTYKYVYLQSNPIVWLSALLSLIIGCSM
ncbi:MAG: phospholipid carrier-dependent glycosyltransferase, partial [Candidatus Staskawiczbacteria bacterium]|nr:phospholipid carrier-dependent glycosyltransferase [Candidatus Staskawiczbacteria bacterium]